MDEGRESHIVYSAYMQRKGAKSYILSMVRQSASNAFRRVFPARVVLMKYVPEVGENAWLLPIAWCKHVLHGIFVVAGKGTQRADNAKANREERKILCDRAALLKQLRIM